MKPYTFKFNDYRFNRSLLDKLFKPTELDYKDMYKGQSVVIKRKNATFEIWYQRQVNAFKVELLFTKGGENDDN